MVLLVYVIGVCFSGHGGNKKREERSAALGGARGRVEEKGKQGSMEVMRDGDNFFNGRWQVEGLFILLEGRGGTWRTGGGEVDPDTGMQSSCMAENAAQIV